MLYFNFTHLLKARGIQRPVQFLMKAGLSRHTADKLLQNDAPAPRLDHIEKLCAALCCTPNDILAWKPSGEHALPADHPLHTLVAAPKIYLLSEKLITLPLEKINELEALLSSSAELKDKL